MRTLVFVICATLLASCNSFSRGNDPLRIKLVELVDYGISLGLPQEWDVSFSQTRFYQIVATFRGPSKLPITLEYRGLDNNVKDDAGMIRYSQGWFEAVSKNYPGWKFEHQRRVKEDAEGAFEFAGSFDQGSIRFRKIGKLRFRKDRVHAIYYTASEEDYEYVSKIFDTIDARHEYFSPKVRKNDLQWIK